MSAPPFMPLYVADYLGDTRHLSTEQHGAYLLLLMAMWRAGGRLQNEGAKLARITGLTPAKWAKLEADVLEFFQVDGADVTHRRIARELEKYQRTSDARSEAGARGGTAKALKTQETALASATILPGHLPQQKSANLEPDYIEAKASLSPNVDAGRTRQYPEPFEHAWKAYPHIRGRSSKPKALGYWRRLSVDVRDLLPSAIARYAREGREPKRDCGAPGMDRWIRDEKFLDWLTPAKPTAPATPELQQIRVQKFRDTGVWNDAWGPKPQEIAA